MDVFLKIKIIKGKYIKVKEQKLILLEINVKVNFVLVRGMSLVFKYNYTNKNINITKITVRCTCLQNNKKI